VANIPIAHIAGGDTTEGAVDEVIRHSLTKMAHLHFTTSEPARRRVIQMGEAPDRVFNTGSPGLDTLLRTPLLARAELEQSLNAKLFERNFLITFHPATLEGEAAAAVQFDALLAALGQYADGRTRFIFTRPNSDAGSAAISRRLDAWLAGREDALAFESLGQLRYLSLVAQVDAVIGNSSSGLYEVPSLKKPTVNIGSRQQGRIAAASVITCAPRAEAIARAIGQALQLDCSGVVNPYGDGHAAERIVAHLRDTPDFRALLHKRFFDLPVPEAS
jgi:UDP-N-acetylglucosamine 2-epimerase (non-hydrolysing)/GDP/UDP-N,N'-diacetylbacillosamine 2-epimerase (hydrolysing)